MAKRVVKVRFVGQFPFVIPLVTYENGESEFLVGGRERELVTTGETVRSTEAPIDSPLARPPLPNFPQLNLKPLQSYLEQLTQNVASAMQRMTPQRQRVYRHEETEAEYIRRLQKEKLLFPTCEDSSMVVTKCSVCDRKEICEILREEEAKRQREFDRMYGVR